MPAIITRALTYGLANPARQTASTMTRRCVNRFESSLGESSTFHCVRMCPYVRVFDTYRIMGDATEGWCHRLPHTPTYQWQSLDFPDDQMDVISTVASMRPRGEAAW